MSAPSSDTAILAILTGKARIFRGDECSAIAKSPVRDSVAIGALGLAGDEQADPVNHGGPDKALHHYPFDHYAFWRKELGDHPLLAAPGGFGENISTRSLTEETVCLGDRFRLGSALLEVSHGRQPCWKLAHRFGQADLVARVVRSGCTGWYYRVLETGKVAPGDCLTLVERGREEWPLSRLFDLLIANRGERDRAALRELAELRVLAEVWRERAAALVGK